MVDSPPCSSLLLVDHAPHFLFKINSLLLSVLSSWSRLPWLVTMQNIEEQLIKLS